MWLSPSGQVAHTTLDWRLCRTRIFTNGVATSADALAFSKKHIQFVEFKSGFKKKITKNTMDKEKAKCDKTNAFCNDYWNLFFKNQETESIGLINSLQMKAADSYMHWKSRFFQCVKVI